MGRSHSYFLVDILNIYLFYIYIHIFIIYVRISLTGLKIFNKEDKKIKDRYSWTHI